MRLLAGIRIGYGSMLLLAPRTVLRDLPHRRIDPAARAVARLLGVRHLLEATALDGPRGSGWILVGAAADTMHSATMTALAIWRPERRLLASTSALVSGALATAGIAEARRARPSRPRARA